MNVRRIIALVLFVACGAAVWALNRRGAAGEITPRPLLYLVADTQREMERIPLELTRISDAKENEIGGELARSEGLQNRAASERTTENNRIELYLNTVGQRLTERVKRPAIHYRFYYIPEDYFVNAAAMPGGQIVIGRGLLRLLDTEDELAAILGHEIAHVDERHSIERMQYELRARQLGLDGIYAIGAPAIQIFEAGYTKEQEADADRIGLQFAVNAGYSPGGGVDAMRRLQELEPKPGAPADSPVEEMAGAPMQGLEEYFRSHPPASQRIAAFEKQIADNQWDSNRPQRSLAIRTIFRTEQAARLDRLGEFQKAIARYRDAIEDDRTYQPARRGLAFALWRSGDAAAAVTAAEDALPGRNTDTALWHLFAFALAARSCSSAVHEFENAVNANSIASSSFENRVASEESGLRVFCNVEADRGLREQARILGTPSNTLESAELSITIAGWMYRAGRLDEASKELETAYQQSPASFTSNHARAWVFSDLGRQADALAALSGHVTEDGEEDAALAMINWRTDQQDVAKQEFTQAAQFDPVWMEPHWAANNYSAKAAAVFSELRAAEIARRKEEEAKKHRAALAGEGNPH